MKHNKEILIFYNKLKHDQVQAENKKIREKSSKEISYLSDYELLLIGACLYWAEEYKRQEHLPSPCVSFVNSDPDMIKLFLRFLREIIEVSEERIKTCIQIHSNVNIKKATNFWSKVTNIDKEKFRITYQTSRATKRVRPSSSLPYGSLQINLNKRQEFFRIMGWIEGLIKESRSY